MCRLFPAACAMTLAAMAGANWVCNVDEADKQRCIEEWGKDQDDCLERFGRFVGPLFEHSHRACMQHAENRMKACLRGDPNIGPYTGDQSFPGERRPRRRS